MQTWFWILLTMLVAFIACFTGYVLHTFIKSKQFKDAELKLRKIENDAKQIINEARPEAKAETQQIRQELKEEVARRRKEIIENEQFSYRNLGVKCFCFNIVICCNCFYKFVNCNSIFFTSNNCRC